MSAATGSRDTRSDGELARAIAGAPADSGTHLEAELYARFAKRVYQFGLRHLRDAELAADLAHDVLARVIERLRAGEVREPDQIASFVLGTARVMAHDERRRARRRHELAARVQLEADAEHVSPAAAPLDLERLQRCLEHLGERERTVILLSFCAEQSAPEIAASIAVSAGNVRVIRHRAIGQLKHCMEGTP